VNKPTVETALNKEFTVCVIHDSWSDRLVKCPTVETALSKEDTVDVILDICSDKLMKCPTIETALSNEDTVDAMYDTCPDNLFFFLKMCFCQGGSSKTSAQQTSNTV
jgi:hypothetical protein